MSIGIINYKGELLLLEECDCEFNDNEIRVDAYGIRGATDHTVSFTIGADGKLADLKFSKATDLKNDEYVEQIKATKLIVNTKYMKSSGDRFKGYLKAISDNLTCEVAFGCE
jgi:hypothetical protein